MELGTAPRAAVGDTGPLKTAPPWWGKAEHPWGPTLSLGFSPAVKHQDLALPLNEPGIRASGISFSVSTLGSTFI